MRQRLLNLSKEKGGYFQLVLTWYGLERLLYRLACSEYSADFVLKGAMLFPAWGRPVYRATRDLDLLGYGNPSPERLTRIFQVLCTLSVEPDGLTFDESSIRIANIREEQEYQGQRVQLIAYLGKARIDLRIDIGYGDVVHPAPVELLYPALLKFPPPKVLAYPPESVVAEKLQAMVAFGMANSRMKDFYDVWDLARQFSFEGRTLVDAIKAIFERRRTEIPQEPPIALTVEFAEDPDKRGQWAAFLGRAGL